MIHSSANMGNAFYQGAAGLLNSQRNIVESANDLVRSGTVERAQANTDIVAPLVKISQQQHIFDASAKVVKMADEALGALIDTQA